MTKIASDVRPSKCVMQVNDLSIGVRNAVEGNLLTSKVNFELFEGKTLAIAGESGSGKSITSLAIMGLLPPSLSVKSGQILMGDQDLTTLKDQEMRTVRGKRVAMIFQEPMTSLNPVMTIGTQIKEAISAHESLSPSNLNDRALEAIKAVRISEPEKRLTQFPHEFSGGMRQRIMIAMALALKPEVLIADEPTTELDVTVQREVLDLLRDLQQEMGTAIILITHDMGVVAEMADEVIVMQNGIVVEKGDVEQVFYHPQETYTQNLLAAVPKIGHGKKLANVLPDRKLVAKLDDLTVRFDIHGGILGRITHRVHAVEHINLDIYAGETISLVGESGCGKSTVARAIMGLVPFSGSISICGKSLAGSHKSVQKSIRRDAQMIFQDPMAALNSRMTIGAIIEEPLVIHDIGDPTSRRERALNLLERVGLEKSHYDRYPHEFSGGQRQRICIARALILEPKLIIADESVSALDVSVQAKVLDLLEQLKTEFGISYLFISHDMAVVENISNRVAVMYMGQIVELGSRDQIFRNPQHAYTKRLIGAVTIPDPKAKRATYERLTGEIPSPIYPVGQGPELTNLMQLDQDHYIAS